MGGASYYTGEVFWLCLALCAAPFWMLGERALWFRQLVLVCASLAAARLAADLSWWSIGLVLLGTAWLVIGLRLTRVLRRAHPMKATLLAVAPLLVAWTVGRFSDTLPSLSTAAFFGFSFLLVKAYTLAKDVSDELVPEPGFLRAGAFLLFFPTAALGPMHLSREFDEAMRRPRSLGAADFIEAGYRILLGLVKIKLLAPLLRPFSLLAFGSVSEAPPEALPVASLVYAVVLWADFSGYSDIGIGAARLLGIGVPENFNEPYFASNIREFWQRWHITFSRVLTGYLFIPISRALQGRMSPNGVMVTAYLATFLLCGFWHGASIHMLLWGLYHAIGLVVYDLFRRARLKARRGKRSAPGPVARALAVAGNCAFVSAGWILFALPL